LCLCKYLQFYKKAAAHELSKGEEEGGQDGEVDAAELDDRRVVLDHDDGQMEEPEDHHAKQDERKKDHPERKPKRQQEEGHRSEDYEW